MQHLVADEVAEVDLAVDVVAYVLIKTAKSVFLEGLVQAEE